MVQLQAKVKSSDWPTGKYSSVTLASFITTPNQANGYRTVRKLNKNFGRSTLGVSCRKELTADEFTQ